MVHVAADQGSAPHAWCRGGVTAHSLVVQVVGVAAVTSGLGRWTSAL